MQFQRDSKFSQHLKREVSLYLSRTQTRYADPRTWLKAISLITASIALYCGILFLAHSFLQRLILDLFFAATVLCLGLNVMHEAAHGNYSDNPWINKTLALSFDFFGISSDLYRIKHSQFHHNYTNIYGKDGDISETPLLRMSYEQPWNPMHRYQVWYTPFLYSLITLTWGVSDCARLITCKVGDQTFRRPNFFTNLKIIFFKLVNLYLTYALPISILGVSPALIFIFTFHLSLGLVLSLIFQVAHVHRRCEIHGPAEPTDWFTHQLRTCADFSTHNRFTNFFMGGLNFQVIHHLFPNISYRHYPEIQVILKKLCLQYQIPYHEFETFSEAITEHFIFLKTLSQKEQRYALERAYS